MTDAAFNLQQLESRPNWYEHIGAVELAMGVDYEKWSVRQDYGWEGDDGGEWGPNPLEPGQDVLESDWYDTLALPFPEEFQACDSYVYELMTTIGEYKHDLALMAHMVALRAAEYLGNVGHDATTTIRMQLRNSYVVEHAND